MVINVFSRFKTDKKFGHSRYKRNADRLSEFSDMFSASIRLKMF